MGMVGGAGITLGGASPGNANTMAAMMDLGLGVPPSTEKKSKKRGSRASISSAKKQAQQQLQQPHQQQYQPPVVTGQSAAISRSNSATAAALLNMSVDRRTSLASLGPTSAPPAGAYGVPSPTPPSYQQPHHQQHGFTTSANPSSVPDASPASAHGFGYTATNASTATGANIANPIAGRISMGVLPTSEDLAQAGKFPEPSPAACGKRKMAEIAAAQMLAGVVGATMAQNSLLLNGGGGAGGPSPKKRASVSGIAAIAAASDNVAEEAAILAEIAEGVTAFAGEDDRPTPPPPPQPAEEGPPTEQTPSFPSVANNPGYSMVGPGMSLQIVNPDTLVDQGNVSAKRRLLNGQASPLTPWDGQLEALVRLVLTQAYFLMQSVS